MKRFFAMFLALCFMLFGCESDIPAKIESQETSASTESVVSTNFTEPPAQTSVPLETEPPETEPLGSSKNPFLPGMYKVGYDLPAGEYFLIALGDFDAYYCVSSDANQSDIIENELFENHSFITVSDGQYFEATKCCFVYANYYTVKISEDGILKSGMYRIGTDIPSGEYKLQSTGSSGYYCIYNNSVAPLDIVDNDLFDNSSYVSVSDGQYLFLDDCIATYTK